tara:strand:- start:20314 stop:21045 length:732 start_codon:yes stop_codon:yes gene_type:complete
MELGVNIDHIATLRQARGTLYPSPLDAAKISEESGADLITIHLREDRRHIMDEDVKALRKKIKTRMNLEIAATDEMIRIACKIKPDNVCLVPERREELTTEGGLDVKKNNVKLVDMVSRLKGEGIEVSTFVDPDNVQIEASYTIGVQSVEIHTGTYADSNNPDVIALERDKVVTASLFATQQGLRVNAGHGLHYNNVTQIANIGAISELNIGHSIISRAVFVGLSNAVQEMKRLIEAANQEAV